MLAAAPEGPLRGVPVTVKDMFSLPWRGYRNGTREEIGAASRVGPVPAPARRRRGRRRRRQPARARPRHDRDRLGPRPGDEPVESRAHVTGGSSSGSAAAVAARLVGGSIGSDSGGSTRLPAGWCGVVGLKVTYRSLPYDGYAGANSTLSGPGAFGRDAADARLLLEALLARPLPSGDGGALRVGIVRTALLGRHRPRGRGRLPRRRSGTPASPRPRSICPSPSWPLRPARSAPARSSASRCRPPWCPSSTRSPGRWFSTGRCSRPRRLVRADRVRARLRRSVADAFASCDLLAWPTNPAPAPPIEAPVLQLPSGPSLPDAPNVRQAILGNLAGVPGISVPAGLSGDGPADRPAAPGAVGRGGAAARRRPAGRGRDRAALGRAGAGARLGGGRHGLSFAQRGARAGSRSAEQQTIAKAAT